MPPGLGQRPLTTACPIVVEQGSLLYKAPAERRNRHAGYAVREPRNAPRARGRHRLRHRQQPRPHERLHRRHVARASQGPARRKPMRRSASSCCAALGPRLLGGGRHFRVHTARSGDATTAYDALNDAAFRALSGCTKPTIAMIHGIASAAVWPSPCAPTSVWRMKRPSSPSPPPSWGLATTRAGFAACSPPCRRRAPRNCCSRGGA